MGQPTSAFLQREFVSQLNGKTMLKPVTSINDLAVFNIRADTLINSVKSVLSRATLLKRRSYVRKYAIVTKYPFSIEAVRSVESLIFRSAEGMLGSSLDHSGVLVKPAKYLARLNKSTIRKVNTTLDDSVILWSRSTFNSALRWRFSSMRAQRKGARLMKPYWPYKFADIDHHKNWVKYLAFSREWHKYTFDTLRAGSQIICRVKLWRFAKITDKRYKVFFRRQISPYLM